MNKETITLTFCESGENHVGMEMLGEKAPEGTGFTQEDLIKIKQHFEYWDIPCELYNLKDNLPEELNDLDEEADILVMRGGINCIIQDRDKLWQELTNFEWDKKYWDTRRRKVLNKHARSNVCFAPYSQTPDYVNRKGTIIDYSQVPSVNLIRNSLKFLIGKKAQNLVCEGNRYFTKKCGIGFHGDTERRRVIALRLGESMPMHWCWYLNSKAIGTKLELTLNDGDMYIMSEKVVGTDWKKRKITTIRHAAGHSKYLKEKR